MMCGGCMCDMAGDKCLCWFLHSDVGCTVAESTETVDEPPDVSDHKVHTGEHMPGSNASTLSTASHSSEHDSANSSLCYEDVDNDSSIVRSVLLSTRENVNIVHESFRQVYVTSSRSHC